MSWARLIVVVLACVASLGPDPSNAQGLQTGQLVGSVVDASALLVPGVTVKATSPALQGTRTVVTDPNGRYVIRGLPPGGYSLSFELSGFEAVTQSVVVDLGKQTEVNASLVASGVAVTITVAARTIESAVAAPTGGQNLTHTEVHALPVNRTPFGIASLAPGLTTNAPNAGQLVISGSFGYDNVYLLDGVDISDNLFGSSNSLYVEDAIEETQVLTSTIPAEYGRFSGGVVNAVTKSGGDAFTGGYRLNVTNDAWQLKTPFEERSSATRRNHLNFAHEGTMGGPIRKASLWFFGAMRYSKAKNLVTLPFTGLPFEVNAENTRAELKLTGNVAQHHAVTLGYMTNDRRDQTLAFGERSVGPDLETHPDTPNDRWLASYRGAPFSRVFAELRYSRKDYGFRNSGGTDPNIRTGSPFFTLTEGYHYHAPYFDGTDPEDRNNWQVAGSLSSSLTTPAGNHDIKAGAEIYNSSLIGGNSQSPSNYVFNADFAKTAAGAPIFDPNGSLMPVWTPGATYREHWMAKRGARLDIKTTSLFVQDVWRAGRRVTLDLGARYEHVRSEATGGLVGVDTDSIVPRVAASFDVNGDGRVVLQSGYARYAGKYSEGQFGDNTAVGNPNVVYSVYLGPAGVGTDFAPGFDPSNYVPFFGVFPTANVSFASDLQSPVTTEFTAAIGSQLGRRGYVKTTYVRRRLDQFVEDFIDVANGTFTIPDVSLTLTNRVYSNSNIPTREYQGLEFTGRYELSRAWSAEGHWTIQLQNEGNFVGEAEGQPTTSSVIGDFASTVSGRLVEALYSPDHHYPVGRLPSYQQHRLRMWTTYHVELGRAGRADLSLLYRFDSPRVFSFASQSVALTATQRAAGVAAGYRDLPASQTLFFGGRGTGEFSRAHLVDLALQYQVPVFAAARPYLKFDVFNVFNQQPLIGFNTTVIADPNSARDALGLPTAYIAGPAFGTGTSTRHYPRPRALQVAIGLRF